MKLIQKWVKKLAYLIDVEDQLVAKSRNSITINYLSVTKYGVLLTEGGKFRQIYHLSSAGMTGISTLQRFVLSIIYIVGQQEIKKRE